MPTMKSATSGLRRDVRLLKIWAVVSSGAVVVMAASAFTQAPASPARFDEINAERINIGRRRAGLAVIDRPQASLSTYLPVMERRQASKPAAHVRREGDRSLMRPVAWFERSVLRG